MTTTTTADAKVEMVDGIQIEDETQEDAMAPKKTKKAGSKRATTKDNAAKKAKKASTTTKASSKAKSGKAAPTKPATTKTQAPAKPSKSLTIGQLVDSHAADLEVRGKSAKTVASYRNDLRVAARYFGEDARVTSLTPKKVAAYFESDDVCANRKGGRRNDITINKIRRTFRMALERLAEVGILEKAPVPETAGEKATTEQ